MNLSHRYHFSPFLSDEEARRTSFHPDAHRIAWSRATYGKKRFQRHGEKSSENMGPSYFLSTYALSQSSLSQAMAQSEASEIIGVNAVHIENLEPDEDKL